MYRKNGFYMILVKDKNENCYYVILWDEYYFYK